MTIPIKSERCLTIVDDKYGNSRTWANVQRSTTRKTIGISCNHVHPNPLVMAMGILLATGLGTRTRESNDKSLLLEGAIY
jgi:hypothetical protein